MDIQGPSQEREAKAACNDVINIYESKIAEVPPLGAKPVMLYQANDGWPRARFDGLPHQYNISLTCLKPYTTPAQTVYQFAHELGHFYQYPSEEERISKFLSEIGTADLPSPWNNWFVESCCCALSYLCLDELAGIWKGSRRRQPLISKLNPSEYRRKQIRESLQEMGISPNEVANWIHSELSRPAIECPTDDKKKHKIFAIEIEKILKRHTNSWGALCYLGDATENQITNFDRWSELVTPEQRPLVKALGQVFNDKNDA
jgi:hypothetical protein